METDKFEEIKGSGDLEGYSFSIKKIDAFHIHPRQKWFRDRIGTRLFRNSNGCPCAICSYILEMGVIVENQFHADYMCDNEGDYAADGLDLKYFETKKEVESYQREHLK